jgi:flagellar biosynthesis protein
VKRAVALSYDRTKDYAPKVIAKGQGDIALKIISMAQELNIPIQSQPALVQQLEQIPLDDHIPPEAFRAVAEILVFLYQLQGKKI